jgi:hypothetical protein
MGSRVIYKIEESEENSLNEHQWEEVQRLQYWYNTEFTWTVGKIAFKRYVLFPNTEEFSDLDLSIWEIIARRYEQLRKNDLTEYEIISQLEKDRLVWVKWGGYFDGCLASGFTRVADNEWNAYLVCDFLLKASTLSPTTTIKIIDEGRFIKTGSIALRDGYALMSQEQLNTWQVGRELNERPRIFSIVNPLKYEKHPGLKNTIPNFNRMKSSERLALIQNWNWLGYGDSYDKDGDDVSGYDLDSKLKGLRIVP